MRACRDFFAGGFLHADDIRTLSTSIASLETQVSIVQGFAEKNFLKLNTQKCEIVPFSCNSLSNGHHKHEPINGLPVVSTAKCLGYWWGRDLLASKSIEENIKKARRAFFSYGSIGAFQGDLNPLSSKSIINSCVMPILLFGSENWILTESLLHKLEAFLGELAKRALKWPQHLSKTAAILALDMETMRSRILCRKLNFLKSLLEEEATGVGAAAMKSLSDDVDSLCLVKECRELESTYGTMFTNDLLTDANCVSKRIVKKSIREIDRNKLVQKCSSKSPSIAGVVDRGGSWPKLWDSALHLGSRHTIGLQNLSRLMSHHGRGQHPCPLCDLKDPLTPVIDHFLSKHNGDIHINFNSTDHLLTLLAEADVCFVYRFWKVFKCY